MEKIQKPDPQNQNHITEFGRLRFYCTKDTWIKSLWSPISKPDEHFGGLLLFEGTVGSLSFFLNVPRNANKYGRRLLLIQL